MLDGPHDKRKRRMKISYRSDSPEHFLARFSLGALIISALILPTGTFAGIPFKHLTFLGALLYVFVVWLKRDIVLPKGLLGLLVGLFSFVLLYILLGLMNWRAYPAHVLQEGVTFLASLSVALLIALYYRTGLVAGSFISAMVLYGSLIYSIWKLVVVGLMVAGIFTYEQVYQFMTTYVGYKFVASGIYGGLIRVNFIIFDYVVASVLVLLILMPGLFSRVPLWLRGAYIFIAAACVFFAYSRLLFLVVGLGAIYAYIFKIRWVAKFLLAGVFSVLLALGAEWTAGVVSQRFSGSHVKASDEARKEQIYALADEWDRAPIIGKGFGAYSPSLIRDPGNPYSYEVQWMGFLTKLGVVGMVVVVSAAFVFLIYILNGKASVERFALAILYTSFILGGLTNQYLINSASGAFYGVIYVLVAMLTIRQKTLQPSRGNA